MRLEKMIQLISLNFSFVPVSSEMLYLALSKENFSPGILFNKCLYFLGPKSNFESSVNVISDFIILLWRKPLSDFIKNSILSSLLNRIYVERGSDEMLDSITNRVYSRLILSPRESNEIVNVMKMHKAQGLWTPPPKE